MTQTIASRKAGDQDRAARHEHLAASYRSLRDFYQQREQTFAQAMDDRQKWEQATARARQLAVAADAELRRRQPGQKIEPLRSAEPAYASDHLLPAADGNLIETVAWIRDLARQREAFRPELDERPRLVMRSENYGKVSSAKTRSHPNRRSFPRRGSSSSPPSTTPNPATKPRSDRMQVIRQKQSSRRMSCSMRRRRQPHPAWMPAARINALPASGFSGARQHAAGSGAVRGAWPPTEVRTAARWCVRAGLFGAGLRLCAPGRQRCSGRCAGVRQRA